MNICYFVIFVLHPLLCCIMWHVALCLMLCHMSSYVISWRFISYYVMSLVFSIYFTIDFILCHLSHVIYIVSGHVMSYVIIPCYFTSYFYLACHLTSSAILSYLIFVVSCFICYGKLWHMSSYVISFASCHVYVFCQFMSYVVMSFHITFSHNIFMLQ